MYNFYDNIILNKEQSSNIYVHLFRYYLFIQSQQLRLYLLLKILSLISNHNYLKLLIFHGINIQKYIRVLKRGTKPKTKNHGEHTNKRKMEHFNY